jgi:uncharacterized NAD(P)/FAD-binding protein YdhS
MSPPTGTQLDVCIIGAGPRGLSVTERICANARSADPHTRIRLHLVDPYPPGAGRVWRTDQSGHLLMNTVASQVTMFTDASFTEGVRAPGPSLYEWANFLTLIEPADEYDEQVVAEARRLGPDSYPTRALQGRYLEWVFRRITGTAPRQVEVTVHRSRAVSLDDADDGRQTVGLEDGGPLEGMDAVVVAVGHLPVLPDAQTAELAVFAAGHGLGYLAPANPADVDLACVRPDEAVMLRGLGLNFFDYMALLTVGRGGRFERRGDRLVYHRSGREPRLYAGSRRGVPHHARGDNEKGAHGRHTPLVLTREVIEELMGRGRLDFRRDVWPLIAKEVETCYYATVLATREACDCEVQRFLGRYLPFEWGTAGESRVLDEFAIPADARWDWERLARPYGDRRFAHTDEFAAWLLDYLRRDLADARAGNVSGPRKAALDTLRDLRNEVRLVVDHGGLSPVSHRDDLDRWYTPLNAFLSIGPPIQRIEEMIALLEAGVLTVLGPQVEIGLDAGRGAFTVASAVVPGAPTPVAALIEARLPDPDLRRTADPLLRHLLATGQCRPFRIGSYETGGLDVTERPGHLLDAAGRAHPRRFAYGVPTEAVHWVTATGARPGVNSVMFGDSDAIARAVLRIGAGPPACVGRQVPNRNGDHLVDH